MRDWAMMMETEEGVRWGQGAECRQPLEAGKSQEAGSLGPPGGAQPGVL